LVAELLFVAKAAVPFPAMVEITPFNQELGFAAIALPVDSTTTVGED